MKKPKLHIEKTTETFVGALVVGNHHEFYSPVDGFPCAQLIFQCLMSELTPGCGDDLTTIPLNYGEPGTSRYACFNLVAMFELKTAECTGVQKTAGWEHQASLRLVPRHEWATFKREIHQAMSNFVGIAAEKLVDYSLDDHLDEELMAAFNKHLVDNNLVDI